MSSVTVHSLADYGYTIWERLWTTNRVETTGSGHLDVDLLGVYAV